MSHYISVLVPTASGRWHAFFPDFPACEAEASEPDLATMHAARALAHLADTSPGEIWVAPPPRDLRDIRSDETWSAAHAIDWPRFVITMIPLNIQTNHYNRSNQP
jgi:hypothetical protein